MKQRLEIDELRKGMYVCDLDRPWLESPFMFQGFIINTDDELAEIKNLCKYVYIDPERAEGSETDARATSTTASIHEIDGETQQRAYITHVEDELKPAFELRTKTIEYMENMFRDVRAGKSIEGENVRALVSGMVASILRNPDALILLNLLREHNDYSVAHSINVCTLTLAFGRYLGLPQKELVELGMGALLHDVGETRVPANIMHKEGLLSKEESLLMQTHARHGADILEHSTGIPASAIAIALAHHERSNGQGYPDGLAESEINYYAKVVGIIDVYDSVTSSQSYRGCISSTEALKNMYNWRNELFDSTLVEQFIQCLGIYPIGSVVELDTGEVGIVISVALEQRLQPKLMLVRDSLKKAYTPPKIINLAQYANNSKSRKYDINKVLEPSAYGIDLKSYLLRELPLDAQIGHAT